MSGGEHVETVQIDARLAENIHLLHLSVRKSRSHFN